MEKKRFFIYCASGLGREMLGTIMPGTSKMDNLPKEAWDEIRFIDDNPELQGQTVNGIEVWSFEQYLESGKLEGDRFFIANGEATICAIIDKKLQSHGLKLGSIIHTENVAPEYRIIGEGCQIGRRCLPGVNSTIGRCVKIRTGSIMGHDVKVGDYCTISSMTFIGGDTEIGEGTYIAPGALLRNGIKIGKNCIIGMGSVVTKDIPDNSVALGNPCRVVRQNESGRVFKK